MSTTEHEQQQRRGQEIAQRQMNAPIPLHNNVISPDKWTTFGRIAYAVAKTDFVPKDLRGKPEAVMACLLYGDSLGLHPSVALTDIYIVDGKPGVSGALMLAKIREAGHRVKFKWVLDEQGDRIGSTAYGQRIVRKTVGRRIVEEVEDEDEWTYTLEDATAAGLYPNSSPKAAWTKTPMVMCRWRALAQLARFLWPDLFRGGSVYLPDEAEEAADANRRNRNGAQTQAAASEDGGIEYGDDPALAAWLVALFAAANEIEDGVWLPKKVRLALKGKEQSERETLAGEVVAWIEERNGIVPSRPEPEEEIEDAVVVDPSAVSDDPGPHLNGWEGEGDGGEDGSSEVTAVD